MSTGQNMDICFKILIIGNSTVGKTCLLLRYCNNKFSMNHVTTVGMNQFLDLTQYIQIQTMQLNDLYQEIFQYLKGVDFQIKRLELNNKKIKLSIWDTAGQEKWRTITTNYYKGAEGVLVAYAVDDRKSFESVENWIKCIRENCDNNSVTIFLVATKCEIKNREITLEEGQNLAKQYQVQFLETSALDNINVNESFLCLTKMCLEQYELKFPNKVNKQKVSTSNESDLDDVIKGPNNKKLSSKVKSNKSKKCC